MCLHALQSVRATQSQEVLLTESRRVVGVVTVEVVESNEGVFTARVAVECESKRARRLETELAATAHRRSLATDLLVLTSDDARLGRRP